MKEMSWTASFLATQNDLNNIMKWCKAHEDRMTPLSFSRVLYCAGCMCYGYCIANSKYMSACIWYSWAACCVVNDLSIVFAFLHIMALPCKLTRTKSCSNLSHMIVIAFNRAVRHRRKAFIAFCTRYTELMNRWTIQVIYIIDERGNQMNSWRYSQPDSINLVRD